MNVAEEEVILWVTSDLCSSTPGPATSSDGTVSASAIPVTLIRGPDNLSQEHLVNTIQYEESKEEYCILEEDVSMPKEKKSRRRGVVWNYFVPTLPDRAQCTFCSATISYKGKSTNNLLRHLRTKHSENNSKLEAVEHKVECLSEDGSTYYVLSGPAEQPASPAPSNSSFQADDDSTSQYKRRGGVWKYFVTDCNKRAKCKSCSTIISFKGGSTTNLLRHMKSKHADIRVPNKISKSNENLKLVSEQSASSIQHSFAEIVNECVKSDDENEFHTMSTIHYTGVGETNSIEIHESDDKDNIEHITTLSSMDPNFSNEVEIQQLQINNEFTEMKERKKSAVAWNYFTMENEERARCGTCGAMISFKGGSTGNLLRHLKTKHSELDLTPPVKIEEPEPSADCEQLAFEAIENKELAKFVQLLNPKYKLQGVQVPRLNDKEVPKRIRKRGAALSYFNITSNDSGMCQLCGATVNLKNGSKAPLLRHLKAKHPETDSLLVSSSITSSNEDLSAPRQSVNIENIENIPMQVCDSESTEKVTRKMRKRGLVWNHFAPLEEEKAKCIVCPAVISYKRGSTSNLLRHMKKKHPDIDVHDEDPMKVENGGETMASEDEDEEDGISADGKSPRKLLRKRGRVWNHFKPTAPDKAKCGLCNVVVVYLKGSTTNLLRHIKKKHPNIDLSKEKPFNKRLSYPRELRSTTAAAAAAAATELPTAMETAGAAGDGSESSSSATMALSTTPSLTTSSDKVNAIYRRSEIIFRKHFDKFLNRPVSVTKSKLYDEQLAKMIVKQYCPFTIVESEEFRKFVQTVNPGYSLPSRKTISSRLIPELYEKCVEEVRERLHDIRYVSIAANGWTLANNERYISITAHCIDDECRFQSYLLDCFRYEEKHKAENLAAEIQTILTEWGLVHKVTGVVSDNAANVTTAIRLRAWRHIPCFANMVNLIVQAGLLEIREAHDKARVLAEHFKANATASKRLAQTLKDLGLPETKLKPDDPHRWTTTYEMFSKLLECRDAVAVSLDTFVESLPMLSGYEWSILEKTCAVLKPLLDITNEVSEKNITISKVIPLSRCVANYLHKTLQEKCIPEEPLAHVIKKMLEEVTLRFSDVEDNALLAEATLLDPRFKNQAFTNDQSYSNTYHSILQIASGVKLNEKSSENDDGKGVGGESGGGNQSAAAASDSNIWAEFDSRVVHLSDVQNPEAAAVAEIENYLQESLINRNADPLVWWRERKSIYPRLFEVMKQRLCIAATAVSKNFTNDGQLVCEKRNKLSSSKVSMVLFLNHNL